MQIHCAVFPEQEGLEALLDARNRDLLLCLVKPLFLLVCVTGRSRSDGCESLSQSELADLTDVTLSIEETDNDDEDGEDGEDGDV